MSEEQPDTLQQDLQKAKKAWVPGSSTGASSINSGSRAAPNPVEQSICGLMSTSDPIQGMRITLRKLTTFWAKHRTRFCTLWAALDQQTKEHMIGDGCIALPRWRGDTNSSGPQQSAGMCLICPELNSRDLARPPSHRVSLPALVDTWVQEDLDSLIQSDVAFFEPLVRSGYLGNKENADDERLMVMLVGAKLGDTMKVLKGPTPLRKNPHVKELFERRCAVENWLFGMIIERRRSMINIVASALDEFRQEILGKQGLELTRPCMSCSLCGGAHRQGQPSEPVAMCSRCGTVAYCSKECQRLDWKRHKPQCKKGGEAAKEGAGDLPELAKALTQSEGTRGWEKIHGSVPGSKERRQRAEELTEAWDLVLASRPSSGLETGEQHIFRGDGLAGSTLGLNLSKAEDFAALQATVYCSNATIKEWTCTRCHGVVEDFQLHTFVHDEDQDLTAFAGRWPRYGNAPFVVFRGTDSHDLGNWIANLEVFTEPYFQLPVPGYEAARVHSGFLNSLNTSALLPNLTRALVDMVTPTPPATVYVLGHSLGGALAALAAPLWKATLRLPRVQLWTFGCPRVGNPAFDILIEAYLDGSARWTHAHDIVPSVPLAIFGYHHFPREFWIEPDAASATATPLPPSVSNTAAEGNAQAPGAVRSAAGHRRRHWHVRACDGSGEDPTCHASACTLGLCRSLDDHVHYLGAHMYHAADEC